MVSRSWPNTEWAYLVAKGLPGGAVGHDHAPLELAGAHPHERDAVAVGRVHVRLDLEHEGRERRVERAGHARRRRRGATGDGARSTTASSSRRTPKFVSAEPKNTGRDLALAEALGVGVGADLVEQRQLVERRVPGGALLGGGLVEGAHLLAGLGGAAGGAGEADVACRRPGRPRRGSRRRCPTGHVTGRRARSRAAPRPRRAARARRGPGRSHLLMKVSSGQVPLAAHLEQLERLRLDALGRVEHHDRGVGRGQDPVGVLGEVAVAGGVEQVQHRVAVRELQHGRRDRDAALLLHLHPVGGDAGAARPGPSPRRPTAARRRRAGTSR